MEWAGCESLGEGEMSMYNNIFYSSDVSVEYKKLDTPQMAHCEYCRSGYDHSIFGNCPQCGAPSSEPMLKGWIMLKGITADNLADTMRKMNFLGMS